MSFEGKMEGQEGRAEIRNAESDFATPDVVEESPVTKLEGKIADLWSRLREGAKLKDKINNPVMREQAEKLENETLEEIDRLRAEAEELKKAA